MNRRGSRRNAPGPVLISLQKSLARPDVFVLSLKGAKRGAGVEELSNCDRCK